MADPLDLDDADETIPADAESEGEPPPGWGFGTPFDGLNAGPEVLEALPFPERYTAERTLGQGGMGVVTLCRDHQIGRRVALKQLRPEFREHNALGRRFTHEARIQAQLEHPSVVPVYALAPDPDGTAYFTMRRVRGMTLADVLHLLRRGDPLVQERHTRRKLLSDFSRLCQAVDYAHQRGAVHRDIKPSNIMLGEYGEVYLLDWGVAVLRNASERGPETLGPVPDPLPHMTGTPGYAAPEQLLDAEAVDARADVYALGCVLFELLTLSRLHPGDDKEARVRSTLELAPPAPSERAVDREVPPELDAICRRALARDPGERYPDARALHQSIEHFLDGARDEALRRTLAAEHAAKARTAAASAVRGTPAEQVDARRQALRQVGRALALDPENGSALQVMLRLLTRPPDVPPKQVEQRLEQAFSQRIRTAARLAGFVYIGLLSYVPFLWWAGVNDLRPMIVIFGLGIGAGLVSLYAARVDRRRRLMRIAMLVSMIAMGSVAWLYGPLVLTPGIIAVNGTAYALTADRQTRAMTLVAGVAALLIPLGLELVGITAASYAQGPEGMTLNPRALALDGPAAVVLLLIASLGTIVTGIVTAGWVRDALDRAERKLEIYHWHFKQLLPEHGDGSSTFGSDH